MHGEGPRDGHPLPHAAGQLRRVVPGEVGEPDQVEHLPGPLAPLRAGGAAQLEGKLDVAPHGAPVEEPGLLERDPVLLVQARLAGRFAGDGHRAPGGRHQVGDDAQQRRLAAAGRADQRHELSTPDGQVDAGERHDLVGPPRVEDLADTGQLHSGGHVALRRFDASSAIPTAPATTRPSSAAPSIAV
ncbi:hypothetical protein Psuf_077400 [Phytohabitans suffuscus]|uniref:Uncharacterized protein n=1 Tax=Phytohabitans suffuscus TaxID=624315 RepID=A0A6F8YWA9_9ACTN|nr:hypothetical protein Psuf_077400 [Phytohabitans suffuscus]